MSAFVKDVLLVLIYLRVGSLSNNTRCVVSQVENNVEVEMVAMGIKDLDSRWMSERRQAGVVMAVTATKCYSRTPMGKTSIVFHGAEGTAGRTPPIRRGQDGVKWLRLSSDRD